MNKNIETNKISVLKIVVNLPVKNLIKSTHFFSELGFMSDPHISNDNMTALVINDGSSVLLVAEPFFKMIAKNAKKSIADTNVSTEVVTQLRVDNRQQVDILVDKALTLGGKPASEPNDQGFLYGRSFQDLDGHIWDVFFMDSGMI
ncbi:hypothetical protein HY945_01015 [Candidatus Gottesmanbacteria bacterium]|nr:hypothetical protein [Candidatus Gottesmanbacteria bacterium]